jgi:hypothetical protein
MGSGFAGVKLIDKLLLYGARLAGGCCADQKARRTFPLFLIRFKTKKKKSRGILSFPKKKKIE